MNSIHIKGGTPLEGKIKIQGSKNAALPVLAGTILIPGVSVIHNCPRIADVFYMIKLLESVGCSILWKDDTLFVDAVHIAHKCFPSEYVVKMRSSITLLGAMLARVGEISLQTPGGCVIGDRPIDMHQSALESLGAVFTEKETGFDAAAYKLIGNRIHFPFSSVGATENAVLASVLAEGTTVIENAAREPEIAALCEFLAQAGAQIEGIGGEVLSIKGVSRLHPLEYTVPADRIVAGTYILAGMAAGGEIYLEDAPIEHLQAVLNTVEKLGGEYTAERSGLYLKQTRGCQAIDYLKTEVYPGFPTDLQSPLMAVLTEASGNSVIEETIFDNRYKVASELLSMGAEIEIIGQKAFIKGGRKLYGKNIIAQELRGGAALVIAGIMAQGDTVVLNRNYIDRGYEDIVRDFKCLGAQIEDF